MSLTADQYKVLGNDCIKNQDFDGAVMNYSLGLKLDPKNPILYCNMAQAYLNLKDYVEAEKCAKKAIDHRNDYVKAYYRAAKGALGCHKVYDSMLCLAQGVQNCIAQDVEELFLMAKELSPEYENALRSFHDKEKAQANKKKGSSSSASGSKHDKSPLKEGASSMANSKSPKKDKVQAEVNDIQKKLKDHQDKHKRLEEELERDTREKRKKLDEEEEQLKSKLRELEAIKKQELEIENEKVREQEQRERDKKARELKEKEERRERERKERERKAQELKEQEMKEQERKDREYKARLAAQEKREQELKEQKRKDLEKREREKKEKEKKEKERKAAEEILLAKQKQEAQIKHELEKKAQELARLKTDLHNQMTEGSHALMKGLHKKAIDSFNRAFDSINSNPSTKNLGIDQMDIVVLHFAFSQARILSDEYNDIIKAIQQLEKMEKENWHRKLPAIFLLLGKAYIRLNRFSEALFPLVRGISFIDRGTSFSIFSWPGTNDIIDLTDRNCLKDALESSIQTCKQYHKPDAICFHENCLNTYNQHILPSRNIFFSDPDFFGFIHIICQELCHIYFHLPCWKDFKENLSEVLKLNEKDFLGRACLTPDCMITNDKPAIIIKVIIVGPDGEEKSSCECTPPPLSPSVLEKERENVEKSTKKKQRKKQCANTVVSKRLRKDSKSHSVVEFSAPRENGQNYKDALAKLAAARQNNFGYGAEAPNPHKVVSTPLPSKLGKDEEFVYSYFLEIFKKEGYMSIYNLQEHWAANKELLPVLKPALITHTDLVKFLLDTDGFAVVQDMIGITSELPNISAIVESKAEAPQPTVFGWTPSAATVLEASKTMSFTSTVDIPEIASEKIECAESEVSTYMSGKSSCEDKIISSEVEFKTSLDIKSNASCSSEENSEGIVSINSFSDETSVSTPDSSNETYNDSQGIKEPVLNACSEARFEKSDEQVSINTSESKGVCDEMSKEVATQALGHSHNDTSCHTSVVNNTCSPENEPIEPFEPVKNIEEINSEGASDTLEPSPLEITHSNQNGNHPIAESETMECSGDVNQNLQPEVNMQPSTPWKPRAKLFEWASETFPNYTRSRLCEALTTVRAQNNYTLSGLTFDVIEDRVRVVLQQDGNDEF